MDDKNISIGLFGIGLDTYWPQFDGLKERLEGYLAKVENRLAAIAPNIINAGLAQESLWIIGTAGAPLRCRRWAYCYQN